MKRLFVLLLFASPALAQQTWIYSNNNYCCASLQSRPNLGITMTLAQPLAPNLQNVTLVPQSFILATAYGFTPPLASIWTFSTDSSGNITAWSILIANGPPIAPTLISTDSVNGDAEVIAGGYLGNFLGTQQAGNPNAFMTYVSSQGNIGTWTLVSSVDPPPQPTIQELQAQIAILQVERVSYLNGYIEEYHLIQQLNAAIMKCRATGGRC